MEKLGEPDAVNDTWFQALPPSAVSGAHLRESVTQRRTTYIGKGKYLR
jgi:hypothetical protein